MPAAVLPEVVSDPLRVVASAVSPIVLAAAILISGVNARHLSISDRVRTLAREYRVTAPAEQRQNARRRTIQCEVLIFQRRLRLISWAARMLYAAVGCFIAVALLISAAMVNPGIAAGTFPLFLAGLVLIGVAILLELMELKQSNETIQMEAADVLADAASGQSPRPPAP